MCSKSNTLCSITVRQHSLLGNGLLVLVNGSRLSTIYLLLSTVHNEMNWFHSCAGMGMQFHLSGAEFDAAVHVLHLLAVIRSICYTRSHQRILLLVAKK